MVNKRLAEWIKAEETQGFSENQLITYLLKRGQKREDIEKAIFYLKQKFNIKMLLRIPPYLIILFYTSLLFLGWIFDEFVSSVLIALIITGSAFLMSYFDEKNKDILKWALFILSYVLFIFIYVPFFLLGLFSLILALIVFFRNKWQINMYLITISLLISTTLAITIAYLIYLFEVFVIIQNLPIMNVIYLALILFAPSTYLLPPIIYIFNKIALSKISPY